MKRLSLSFVVFLLPMAAATSAETLPERWQSASLFDLALFVSSELDPGTDQEACRKAFADLVADTRESLSAVRPSEKERLTPRQTVAVLNKKLLSGRSVRYISNKYWRDSVFTSALMKKRGNCVATSLLYYLVGRELKLPIKMCFSPGHALVRWDDGESVLLVETTRSGNVVGKDHYMKPNGLVEADLKPNGFLVSLSEERIRAELLLCWSNVYHSMENRKRAWQMLNAAESLVPGIPAARYKKAEYLQVEGRGDEAARIYEELMKHAKGPWARSKAVSTYSLLLQRRGKVDEAIELLMQNIKAAPLGIQKRMIRMLGLLYRHKRQFEKAIPFYEMLAAIDPSASTFQSLGGVLSEARKTRKAIEAFEKAHKLNPESFFIQIELAVQYERVGEKARGRAIFAKIKEPRDRKLSWHHCAAWYYANIKEETKMLHHMAEAFKLDMSGTTYQYFKREQDMDPYRKNEAFQKLMTANRPNASNVKR